MFWDGREWVADISKAQDIPNGFAALDTACQHGLADAEYVVQPGMYIVHKTVSRGKDSTGCKAVMNTGLGW